MVAAWHEKPSKMAPIGSGMRPRTPMVSHQAIGSSCRPIAAVHGADTRLEGTAARDEAAVGLVTRHAGAAADDRVTTKS